MTNSTKHTAKTIATTTKNTEILSAKEMLRWRQALGVSQARASEMLGVSRTSVSLWEVEEVPIDVRTTLACRWLLAMSHWQIDEAERRTWMRAIGRWNV
jgi:DNA-binding XRE family transcriptional regulator